MNLNILSGLIFVAVFAGVVIIHEFGHYIVALLCKVEVEEFGIGLPPRALKLWRRKGYFIHNSQRIEIPSNFDRSLDWHNAQGHDCKITVNKVDDKFMLGTLEYIEEQEVEQLKKNAGTQPESISVDEKGKIIAETKPKPVFIKKTIQAGTQRGETELSGVVDEIHPGTDFTLNWLPLGGFVRPKGENDPTIKGGLAAASPWARLAVLFAGSTMNLIAGILVFSFLFSQIGIPNFEKVQISNVLPDSPAAQAGLQAGDILVSLDGKTPTDTEQTRTIIYAHLDQPVKISVLRDGETVELTVTPLSTRNSEQGAVGIQMGPAFVKPESFLYTIPYGTLAAYGQARMLISLPALMLRGAISPEEGRFIGLKGIFDLFGQAVSRDVESRAPVQTEASTPAPAAPRSPSFYTLQLIAMLTVSIGLFNLFPFPALDGGRIFFVIPELILRRRVSAKFENYVHGIGMAILLLFMLYINVMDFVNPAQMVLP
ncbi:MAG: M50 family metallopeptidase [Anaerolineales bacterium]|nr:M50 family metallopeptidase [Anaerolineales bacterium]